MAITEHKPVLRAPRSIGDPLIVSAAESAVNRPGDARSLFAGSLTGPARLLAPLTIGTVVVNDDGAALRVPSGSNPVLVAHRQDFAVETGLVYAARWVLRRAADTSDPYGDAVECKLAWLDRNKGLISTTTVAARALTVADGRFVANATFSLDGEGVDAKAPSGARYVRPYVRLLGGNGQTDISVLDRWVTTGLPGPKGADGREPEYFLDEDAETIRWRQADGTIGPALDIGSARKKAEAARDIAQGFACDIVSQGNVPIYASRVGIAFLTVPAGISALRTNGYYVAGDGGGALYKRVGVEPSHAGKFQSADGAWWELLEAVRDVRMYGARGDGASDDTPAFRAAFALPCAVRIGFALGSWVLFGTVALTVTLMVRVEGRPRIVNTCNGENVGFQFPHGCINSHLIGDFDLEHKVEMAGADTSPAIIFGGGYYWNDGAPPVCDGCSVEGDIRINLTGSVNSKAVYIFGHVTNWLVKGVKAKGLTNFCFAGHWVRNGVNDASAPTMTWHPDLGRLEDCKADGTGITTFRAFRFSALGRADMCAAAPGMPALYPSIASWVTMGSPLRRTSLPASSCATCWRIAKPRTAAFPSRWTASRSGSTARRCGRGATMAHRSSCAALSRSGARRVTRAISWGWLASISSKPIVWM
ncbi:hypothetical protein [Aureimonas populi]|uniref:Uncharacterized protein n=1 Tax=Aureimonas populi TaxID=1701758 RepID=A0ABW5CGP1_9HYPH|nr:hypothetical protein [Aureimonas populi]